MASSTDKKGDRRETWRRNFDFVLGIMGMMIGLGNVWRFPYLCYKNGGGVFLIPYFIFIIIMVWPMVIIETTLGQYSGCSAVVGWTIVPLMRGIAYFGTTALFLINISYPVIITWCLRWFFASFSSVLPWTSCNSTWNTENCISILKQDNKSSGSFENSLSNSTILRDSSSEEFWKFNILGITSGIHDQGSMKWDLLGCLAVVWILIYFSLWKGIGWTSKVIYVTATLPLVMIVVVIVRGATLTGAENGIYFYLKPNVTKLQEIDIWYDAAAQVLYSASVGSGTIATLSQYNKFNHNFFRDSVILLFANAFASFLAGFAIFSVLGYLAEVKNTTISDVVESGPGLVFVAYPTALSFLPLPQLWSAIFFFTLILLGFSSEMMLQEAFIGCVRDIAPKLFGRLGRKILLAIMCLVMFLVGSSMMTQGGVYVFNIFDQYAIAGWCMFFLATWECITIGWMYGADKMCDDIEYMLGYKIPRIWFKICWKFVTPVTASLILIYTVVKYRPLTYNKTYVYPVWANVIAWMLALSSMVWIPGTAIYQLWKAEGNSLSQKFKSSIATPIERGKIRNRRMTEENDENSNLKEENSHDEDPQTNIDSSLV